LAEKIETIENGMERQAVTLQEALDIVESLPVESLPGHQQENLVRIIRLRNLERRRELIVQNIEEARAEYAREAFNRGTAEDLMKELTEFQSVEENEL
jgi:hypothetical protein